LGKVFLWGRGPGVSRPLPPSPAGSPVYGPGPGKSPLGATCPAYTNSLGVFPRKNKSKIQGAFGSRKICLGTKAHLPCQSESLNLEGQNAAGSPKENALKFKPEFRIFYKFKHRLVEGLIYRKKELEDGLIHIFIHFRVSY
ncbi:MAG: hypothetical protein ACUVXF_07295, partial [Desulfobaccales bacterium]